MNNNMYVLVVLSKGQVLRVLDKNLDYFKIVMEFIV